MRMEQLDERGDAAGVSTVPARLACAVAGLMIVTAAVLVMWLRAANDGVEPEGRNWWLVAWLVASLAFTVAGTALLTRSRGRLLGAVFVAIGVGWALTAVSTQYLGYRLGAGQAATGWLARAATWSRPLADGLLAGVVPLLLARRRGERRTRSRDTAVAAAIGAVVLTTVVAAFDGPAWMADVGEWAVAVAASVGVAALAAAWRRCRARPGRVARVGKAGQRRCEAPASSAGEASRARASTDPLPAWLLAGAVAAWLAVVPEGVDLGRWTMAGSDVVTALLVLATVPLLVGGAVIDAIRDSSSSFLGMSHRVLEWGILASGIVALYTGLVAGLGRLLGGSGPTWLLVGATGAIALALEPARRWVRHLVDRLVYGDRDDPLAVVQRIVDHLGADAGDDLLPALVANLQAELRLDAVAIDLRSDDGWRPAAAIGPPTTHRRVVVLTHRGEVAGRLVVGWQDGPSLRDRDERILQQIAGPLSLAVGWVRLADDLRRSSVAIVSAREEERRRLRRDLHDGLGPSLTGVSLGLRTAVRQLGRVPDADVMAPARGLLERVADEVDAAVAELKRIVRDLRPTALDQLGLLDAVAEFTRGFGDALEIHLTMPAQPVALPAAVEVATYRIVTEAVTNVVRHARAARCWLTIEAGPSVVIDVVDDGVGIGPGDEPGVGLTAMHERAAELGGSVHVLANRPRGTRVHVMLPAALP
jgi:signal transduction histidine kinase